jgi:aryl-alcohol dehydrogenase-like predicted oxidoreductase
MGDAMQHRDFGRSGIRVSCIGYGTNMLGRKPSKERSDDDECTTEQYYERMVQAALDEGIDLVDTADCYQEGRSEQLLGKALSGTDASVLVATKCGAISRDFSAEGIRRDAEACLHRLQTGRIDLLQLHNPSFDELKDKDWSAGFDSLQREGKVRFRGVSVGTPEEGVWLVERDLVDAVQVNFNIFRPEARDRLLPLAVERGVAVLTKIPLARGLLSGKYGSETCFPEGDWHRQGFVGDSANMLEKVDRLKELAQTEGTSLARLALRWVLCHEGVSAAIPGAKRIEHVRDNANAGTEGPLSDEVYGAVEQIVGRAE